MGVLKPAQATFIDSFQVARLATVGPGSRPHVVPICFIRRGDNIYTAIDRKPKRTTRLQRLRNIESTGVAAVLFDRYSNDWSELGWVLVRGAAVVVPPGAERDLAVHLLGGKYAQYGAIDLTGFPVIRVTANQVATWGNLN